MSTNLSIVNEKVRAASEWTILLRQEISKVIVGQKYLVERLLTGILANGHVLLEGVPGLAKTLAVKRWRRLWRQNSTGFNSPPTSFLRTLSERLYTTSKKANSSRKKGLFSQISFWLTKSTAHQQKSKALCWKPCRNDRSQ